MPTFEMDIPGLNSADPLRQAGTDDGGDDMAHAGTLYVHPTHWIGLQGASCWTQPPCSCWSHVTVHGCGGLLLGI